MVSADCISAAALSPVLSFSINLFQHETNEPFIRMRTVSPDPQRQRQLRRHTATTLDSPAAVAIETATTITEKAHGGRRRKTEYSRK